MSAETIKKSIADALGIIILTVVSALILATLLAQTVFTTLTIINVTAIAELFGSFVTALLGFLVVVGVVLGVVWLIGYLKPLFDKKTGLASFTG